MPPQPTFLDRATQDVLRLLSTRHNVLVSGAPGTGKTILLSAVARAFAPPAGVTFDPGGTAAFPLAPAALGPDVLPSPERTNRKVWSTTFHQGSKYRDFVRGLMPSTDVTGPVTFTVQRGILFEAAEHARSGTGASLVMIDEINRGPAIAVFGDTITAIESDKRLAPDGSPTARTATFQMIDDDGSLIPYQLPHHLYLLAAMNQADTSVEPLDVAFMRRWEPYTLRPDRNELLSYFSLDQLDYPDAPSEASHVYSAAVAAWLQVNERIERGRGAEFQIGHGVLMRVPRGSVPATVEGAAALVADAWNVIRAHVDEVFFGDNRAIGEVLGAGPGRPFTLEEYFFAGSPGVRINGPKPVSSGQVYGVLRGVAQ